jgi:hypothetical protein
MTGPHVVNLDIKLKIAVFLSHTVTATVERQISRYIKGEMVRVLEHLLGAKKTSLR